MRERRRPGTSVPWWIVCLVLLGRAAWAREGDPPDTPILRLETGMHVASIRGAVTDVNNRYFVTASDDKTLRVWDLGSGRLLQTLRPPVGEGNRGKLYAVSLSPDARIIATGGWDEMHDNSIFLFERERGAIVHRIGNLPNTVNALAYSPDGRFLAVGMGHGGIRVYRTAGYDLVREDSDYRGDVWGVEFAVDGRLVTACADGFVRLYQPDFKLGPTPQVPYKGESPFSVSFSPDGKRIAVGFHSTSKVALLRARDLSLLPAPDLTGISRGAFSTFAWSRDGEFLFGGGTYFDGEQAPIVRWASAGEGQRTELRGAPDDSITKLIMLKDGRLLFAGSRPNWGIYGADGSALTFKDAATARFGGLNERLLLSRNGAEVQFGYEPRGMAPARLSIPRRLLELEGGKPDLFPPLKEAPGLRVTGEDSFAPQLNGKPLPLMDHEFGRRASIVADGSVLLGSEWYVRRFDREGKELWRTLTPSTVWTVNAAKDGSVAVAALGDGTLRWYRIKDGTELLAFFPHADRKRWVLWTPSGYYDASPGAEDLIGWHLNHGREQAADFFPASRFREAYYRPDIVAKVLPAGDEAEAIKLANAEAGGKRTPPPDITQILPPVVRIVSPAPGATTAQDEITVKVAIRSPSGTPVTGLKVLVDGRPRVTNQGLNLTGDEVIQELSVPLPERDCEVAVIASNRDGESVAVRIPIRWVGRGADPAIDTRPKLYVLAVGASYQDKTLDTLKFAGKDAEDFTNALVAQKGRLYRDVEAQVLPNTKATRAAVLGGLQWIKRQTTSNDVAMIFLSGHGTDDEDGAYYFLPSDTDPDSLLVTAVPWAQIKGTVTNLSGKVLFFVDTCRAGNLTGGQRRAGGPDIQGIINDLISAQNSLAIFAATRQGEYAQERAEWGNGAFTKALVEGFGGANAVDGRVTTTLLAYHVRERVKELTRGTQHPTLEFPKAVEDIPVAIVVR